MSFYPQDKPTTGTCVGMAISGTLIDLAAPRPEDVHIGDILFMMTRISRYNGATLTKNIWSVGDHLRVCKAVYLAFCEMGLVEPDPQILMHILLHDAAESYTGDMTSPFKRLLRRHDEIKVYTAVTARLDQVIAERFGLRYPLSDAEHGFIKDVDQFAYEIERALHRPVFNDNIPLHPLSIMLLQRPEMHSFRQSVDLQQGWQLLRDDFAEVAAALPTPGLAEALRACQDPYAALFLEQAAQNLAAHLQIVEPQQSFAYEHGV